MPKEGRWSLGPPPPPFAGRVSIYEWIQYFRWKVWDIVIVINSIKQRLARGRLGDGWGSTIKPPLKHGYREKSTQRRGKRTFGIIVPPSSCLSLVQNLESGGAVAVEKCAVPLRNGKLAEANLELRRAAGEGEFLSIKL